MINVGFIGAGNMGYAIMKGIAGSKMSKDIQLYAFDKYAPILDRLDELGTVKCSGCAEVVEKSEYVFLAIKPQQLDEVLGTLTEREQKVLKLRFGLEDGRARTLEEVGKEFKVTRERIRQIEAKALRKLRHPSRSRKLKDYLE